MTRDISQRGEGHQKCPHAISLVAPPSPHSTATLNEPRTAKHCAFILQRGRRTDDRARTRVASTGSRGVRRESRASGRGTRRTAGNSPSQRRTIVSSCRRETLTGCDHTARQYRRGHVAVVIPERVQLKQRPSLRGVRLSSRSRDCVAI